MTAQTTAPASASADALDDPLSQAMSMLDSLGGAGGDDGDFEDFAIDSDDDEEVDLNDLEDFDLDLDSGLSNGGDNVGGELEGGPSTDSKETNTGAVTTGNSGAEVGMVGTTTSSNGASGPPEHWATKQDVTELSSISNDGGAVNSTTATSLKNSAPAMIDPLLHPGAGVPHANITPAPATKTGVDIAAAVGTAPPSARSHPPHPQAIPPSSSVGGGGGSWTSSFASFASRAAASVQSAVENAEAAVLQQGGHPGGLGGPHHGGNAPGGIRIAQNSHLQQHQQQQRQGGVPNQNQQPRSGGLSYQERQKLLHQQYHAKNGGGGAPNSARQSPASVLKPPVQPPAPVMPRQSPQTVMPGQSPQTVQSAPSSPQKASSAAPTISTAPSFLDKLTSSLDTPTKTKLISSALGKLLPGERVIMFLNSLKDVRDSSFGSSFVGSGDLLGDGLAALLGESGGVNGGVNGGEDGASVVTVWCCVMTFYRVAVFSYRATLDGKVLLDDADENDESIYTNNKSNEEMIKQWLDSQNVSIQFQSSHYPPTTAQAKQRRRHHVFQMPLASIERVEKTYANSQKAAMGANPSASGYGGSSGYSYNAILPSSSTVSSTASTASGMASSAMVSLGSQMKPLLGGMAGSSSNSNLQIANGGSNPNLATAGSNGTPSAPSGPLGIVLHGKDGGRYLKFSTSSHSDAQRAHDALNTYAFPGRRNLGYLFAFESRRAEVMASTQAQGGGQGQGGAEGGNPIATAASPTRRRFVPMEEYGRQGIFSSRGGTPIEGTGSTMSYASPWAPILNANANYGLCSSYPSVLVGPRSIVGDGVADGGNNNPSGHSASSGLSSQSNNNNENAGLLRRCAAFRSENRFPALTWGSSHHGGSIWRSSQPKVGLQGNRSTEDERYLYAIGEEAKRANLAADARREGGVGGGSNLSRPPVEFLRMLCGRNNEGDLLMLEGGPCMLKIMDMRPKSAAMGNRTQGYGYENTNNYRGTTINFYGIGNIHAVRDAYQKVNALCLNPNTSDLQWMQLVENTNWPSMIRLILSASWQTAFHVHYNRLPVLVHCSHGWDRTSQVPALAQLLLDPHYRTREGFSTLVEKDFLSFGHPFHTRCGHGEGKNEQGGDEGQLSPIFLQFLDCVFQLVNQFPDYFEFNARYLLLLSEHIYSCRFGTLLCDSEREREVVAGTRQRTYCMWDYLDSIPELVNPMFDRAASDGAGVLLMPLSMLLRNVTLWTDRYCMYGAKATMPCAPPGLGHAYPPTYLARPPSEQPLALHTTRNGVEGMLSRALEDVEMWKGTALAALKEVKELKQQGEGETKKDDGDQ